MKKIFILFIIFIYYSTFLFSQNEDGNVLNKGDKMPDFQIVSTVYNNVDSKNLEGKVVLINIFATWCRPCQMELAKINEELWPKYGDNPNFVMLTIGREHTDEELSKYNEKKGFPFPLYPDPKRDFTSKFAKISIPRSYLVDKAGKIIYTSIGFDIDEFNSLIKLIDRELEN